MQPNRYHFAHKIFYVYGVRMALETSAVSAVMANAQVQMPDGASLRCGIA